VPACVASHHRRNVDASAIRYQPHGTRHDTRRHNAPATRRAQKDSAQKSKIKKMARKVELSIKAEEFQAEKRIDEKKNKS
jgi:hypothetical protein